MSLELRHGIVTQLSTEARMRGKGSQITVAAFHLDGLPVEFDLGELKWGSAPATAPFQNGDEIIISGKFRRKSIFKAYSLYAQKYKLLKSQDPYTPAIAGIIICALSIIMTKSFFGIYQENHDFYGFIFLLMIFFGIFIMGISIIIRESIASVAATRMIETYRRSSMID